MKYKKLTEVPPPYYIIQTASYKPILVGNATLYSDKDTSEPKAISGIAMIPFYLAEPGQDIAINLKYCVTWSHLSVAEAQYWLDLIVINTSKVDAGLDISDLPKVQVPACDFPS